MFNEIDKEITLVGEYYPGCKGSRDSEGLQIEPDDESRIDLVGAEDDEGNVMDLSPDEEQEALEKLGRLVDASEAEQELEDVEVQV